MTSALPRSVIVAAAHDLAWCRRRPGDVGRGGRRGCRFHRLGTCRLRLPLRCCGGVDTASPARRCHRRYWYRPTQFEALPVALRRRFDQLAADPHDVRIAIYTRQHVTDEATNVGHRCWLAFDGLEGGRKARRVVAARFRPPRRRDRGWRRAVVLRRNRRPRRWRSKAGSGLPSARACWSLVRRL